MDAAAIRARLDHPIIDADGHIVEFLPLIRDFLAEEADETVAKRFDEIVQSGAGVRALSPEDRRRFGISRTGWWGVPSANTLDRATAMLPKLLYERLDELGIDVAILYPTAGLMAMALDDDELRCALARACNRYAAECFGEYSDRLLPVAVVPNSTPEEALAELDHAVGVLGLRPVLFGGLVLRAAPGHDGDRAARWVDGLGLDSAYDYDPVWARCVELGVSPTFHSTGIGFGSRTSPTNYVANHIGNFAAGSEAVCRSLLFGGAMRRFPELRFAFLEGGVAWACNLYADVVGHWQKRNRAALGHYDPAALDRPLLDDLVGRYGADAFTARLDRLGSSLRFLSDPDEDPAVLDEFGASGIESLDDLRFVFGEQCFFGCEADDPMNALAFDTTLTPMQTRLRAMFASDIGHWDVPDFRGVLAEAWELVEDGHIDEEGFRAFTFEHAAQLFTGTRPDFFDGTVVEAAVRQLTP
ncbi:MAG: amidohydrolase family protein [Acidimicrobiia bacterium]